MAKNKKQAMKKCGIIMPISLQRFGTIEYPPEYWNSMLGFLKDAIAKAGYEPVPMWEDASNSSITPRIVKNVMEVPLAVCVISAFNPNVMMELGMRLCSKKPVLVLFDENISSIPFDIKDLEAYQIPSHPIYNQYPSISKEISGFLHKMDNPEYKPFLDNFSLTTKAWDGVEKESSHKLSVQDEKLRALERRIASLESEQRTISILSHNGPTGPSPTIELQPSVKEDWLHCTQM